MVVDSVAISGNGVIKSLSSSDSNSIVAAQAAAAGISELASVGDADAFAPLPVYDDPSIYFVATTLDLMLTTQKKQSAASVETGQSARSNKVDAVRPAFASPVPAIVQSCCFQRNSLWRVGLHAGCPSAHASCVSFTACMSRLRPAIFIQAFTALDVRMVNLIRRSSVDPVRNDGTEKAWKISSRWDCTGLPTTRKDQVFTTVIDSPIFLITPCHSFSSHNMDRFHAYCRSLLVGPANDPCIRLFHLPRYASGTQ
jgi:hypothetical protein